MKHQIKTIILALAVLISFAFVTAAHAEESDIVAYIKGKPITKAELADAQYPPSTKIAERQGMRLFGMVLGALLKDYSQQTPETVPSDAEVEAYERHLEGFMQQERARWRQKEAELRVKLADKSLDEKARASLEEELKQYESMNAHEEQRLKQIKRDEATAKEASYAASRQMLMYWKTNRALFKKYGGRVIFQQAGPEPIDAYAKLIKEHEKKGTFRIVDSSLLPGFWKYLRKDNMHTFLDDNEETRRMMLSDWWLEEADQK